MDRHVALAEHVLGGAPVRIWTSRFSYQDSIPKTWSASTCPVYGEKDRDAQEHDVIIAWKLSGRREALLNLSKTSTLLRKCTERYRFETIIVWTTKQLFCLFRTLIERSDLAAFVKSLNVFTDLNNLRDQTVWIESGM
jgi:hypothetical protein